MARNEIGLEKSLYFCNVKNQVRHEVAAESSVFRASYLVVKIYPSVCGSSNARKGFALEHLDSTYWDFILSKI